ncbi:MAG: thiamine pyrophosphate-binding protein [Phycisphaerae bacterium]|nr:thiamine pyrophosphate-binding protein [Phycisphaerae bacterium]
MNTSKKQLLSGNEAIALAAYHWGVKLGTGYPGTPSTEILENFSRLGGKAQWAPNEKVALEVGIGAAYSGARTLVTMKHVGVNVAADPLFTAAYTGVSGGLVLISADDPGMASSQNEQDNRHYARAAGVVMLEPADSQESYDFLIAGLEISEKWKMPVILRLTTRICHSKTIVQPRPCDSPSPEPSYQTDRAMRVMVPANARPAHKKLRQKLSEVALWNETSALNQAISGDKSLGIITSGISFMHALEAAPQAGFLKLGITYPLPIEKIRQFANSYERCVVIEEGDPYLVESIRAAGVMVEGKDEMYRFGELNVERVKRILAKDASPEAILPKGKPPQLCQGCPHRITFEILRDMNCIVSGDIGCYTLGVLPPFSAIDTCLCMGASISVGLGMRHVLDEKQARKIVSVIGDSTFMHSGITGLVEMVYNRPQTGHLVIVLDNNTTAMTGLQEHPGTGYSLDRQSAHQVSIEELSRSLGIEKTYVMDPRKEIESLKERIAECLAGSDPAVIVVRSPCILSVKARKK